MAVLDFNTVKRNTLDLTMMDDAHTVIRVCCPTEGMVRELEAMSPELDTMASGSKDGVNAIYDLAAKLISRNRDYIAVTAAELRGKYRMDLEDMIVFYNAYTAFVAALIRDNEKN